MAVELQGERYRAEDLTGCAAELFAKAGLEPPMARVVAEILVEADLLGYDTHGLQFVAPNVAAIEAGRTVGSGEPEILRDGGNTLLLDGKWLPGQWVLVRALEMACQRAPQHGVVSVSVRRAQNVSCLATYARRVAERGLLGLVMTSAPTSMAVAPHGGAAPRLSTNPLAVGIPTQGHPILIDTSTSSTSNGKVNRYAREGKRLPHAALVTAEGQPSDDPATLKTDPPGAILPLGGIADGHRGFAFSLLVEAMTSALCGWGRAKGGEAGGNTVFLQVIDPGAFGGAEAFRAETAHLAAFCRDTPPQQPNAPVRVPGDRSAAAYAEQLEHGVLLHPAIMPAMRPLLAKYGIAEPQAV